jgi:hypothetical protein
VVSTATAVSPSVFAGKKFVIRQKIWTLATQKFFVEDEAGNALGFFPRKIFKLKEDIRLYADDTMTRELLKIQARSIIDFSVAFDVVDGVTGQKVGVLKRRGWKSILKDEWILMDAMDQEIGRVKEDSALLAMVRRFATNLIPQKYHISIDAHEVGTLKQNFNMFAPKLLVDLTQDPANRLDSRLGLAAAMLLMAVEGRQK